MDAFAGVTDLEKDWRSLTAAEKTRATHLLGRATLVMVAELPGIVQKIDTEKVDVELVKYVCGDMVKQAMLGPTDQPAATNIQQTNGPFNRSMTLAQQVGALYVTKKHRRWLGYGEAKAGQINPLAGRVPR